MSGPCLLGLQLTALWGLAPWLWARLQDGTGEHGGPFVWLCAAGLLVMCRRDAQTVSTPLWLPALATLAYVLLTPFAPPLVRALPATFALAALLSSWRLGEHLSWPLLALLVLGLPIEASLQFYLGYPMRLLSSHLAEPLLAGAGLGAAADGTWLTGLTRSVSVEGPCSGLRSLRLGLAFVSGVALARHAGFASWALSSLATLGLLVFANALRVSSLAVMASLPEAPDWLHPATGMVTLACALAPTALAVGAPR